VMVDWAAMAIPRFQAGRTGVLVVDMQEKLLPLVAGHEALLSGAERLCRGAMALDVPLLFTEQYRKGLGDTASALHAAREAAVACPEKLKFSACVEQVRSAVFERDLRGLVVCGIETHICVLQTCLEFASSGLVTGVCVDACGSRNQGDHDAAVQRLLQAGVLPVTVESVLMELVGEAGSERFRAVLPIIK